MQPVLIAGEWREAKSPAGSFQAVNPSLKAKLPEIYPVSSAEDVERAVASAQQAVAELRSLPPGVAADFLEAFAGNIEARKNDLVEMAYTETALAREPRLATVELPRTTNQLRQAAQAVRDRSWCLATIDTKLNIRSKYGPLAGPVVVFGPNNFPFAFNSAAGGDFAAAIAAGNPVIGKANTSHPGTTKIFAEVALEAIHQSGAPKGMVQLLYRLSPADGYKLVSHPLVGATGFTGSKSAGLRLKEAADKAGKPIYLEMSSINPVFILPGAIEERGEEVAKEFFSSCTLGAGQFCTNPGLVLLLKNELGERFLQTSRQLFEQGAPGVLLSERGRGISPRLSR
jgi:NADP-dependent aldehyde dehydrogenase